MEGYQWGGRRGRRGVKVQGIRNKNGRYKIDRGSGGGGLRPQGPPATSNEKKSTKK